LGPAIDPTILALQHELFAKIIEIPPSQLLPYHNYINLISLTIDNQKNGKRGKTL